MTAQDTARRLEALGRGGDTMLAHINPREALLLRAMGGAGTINPATGLPEFFAPSPGGIGAGGAQGIGSEGFGGGGGGGVPSSNQLGTHPGTQKGADVPGGSSTGGGRFSKHGAALGPATVAGALAGFGPQQSRALIAELLGRSGMAPTAAPPAGFPSAQAAPAPAPTDDLQAATQSGFGQAMNVQSLGPSYSPALGGLLSGRTTGFGGMFGPAAPTPRASAGPVAPTGAPSASQPMGQQTPSFFERSALPGVPSAREAGWVDLPSLPAARPTQSGLPAPSPFGGPAQTPEEIAQQRGLVAATRDPMFSDRLSGMMTDRARQRAAAQYAQSQVPSTQEFVEFMQSTAPGVPSPATAPAPAPGLPAPGPPMPSRQARVAGPVAPTPGTAPGQPTTSYGAALTGSPTSINRPGQVMVSTGDLPALAEDVSRLGFGTQDYSRAGVGFMNMALQAAPALATAATGVGALPGRMAGQALTQMPTMPVGFDVQNRTLTGLQGVPGMRSPGEGPGGAYTPPMRQLAGGGAGRIPSKAGTPGSVAPITQPQTPYTPRGGYYGPYSPLLQARLGVPSRVRAFS